jgi:hypothetical protein
MNFNIHRVNSKGRNIYGDYRSAPQHGWITDGSTQCTYELRNLQVSYSSAGTNYVTSNQSVVATLTGTFTIRVNGEVRTSMTVPVTPKVNSLTSPYVTVRGSRVIWNTEEYGATEVASGSTLISGSYAGIDSSSYATIVYGPNTVVSGSSQITYFSFPTNFGDAETSAIATASATRTYTYTSGKQSQSIVDEIRDGDTVLELSSSVNWMYPVDNSVDISHNVAFTRTGVLTVKDSLFPTATSSITVSQIGTHTGPGHVYLKVAEGEATPYQQDSGEIDWEVRWDDELGEIISQGSTTFMYGSPVMYGANDVNIDYTSGSTYPVTRTVYYEVVMLDGEGTFLSRQYGTASHTITTAPVTGEIRTESIQLPNLFL